MAKCPECLESGRRTKWTPPAGYDPYLAEYKCTKCSNTRYEPSGTHEESQGVRQKSFNKCDAR